MFSLSAPGWSDDQLPTSMGLPQAGANTGPQACWKETGHVFAPFSKQDGKIGSAPMPPQSPPASAPRVARALSFGVAWGTLFALLFVTAPTPLAPYT